MSERRAEPGADMLAEIREQPRRVRDALSLALPKAPDLARAVSDAHQVVVLGRGSSRSAATYAAHALRAIAQRPALVASPAELAWGDWSLPLAQTVVVAISQSGESREMVAAAQRARELGARLVVVTNTSSSSLAALAARPEDVLDCAAGTERAVPATKSFTTSLAAVLAIAAAGRPRELAHARDTLPELIQGVLDDERSASLSLAVDSFALAGEGYGEAVAEEGAIKLRETLIQPCASFETSEFLHGSINSSSPTMGVITVESDPLSAGLAGDVVSGAAGRGAVTIHIGRTRPEGVDQWVPLPDVPASWSPFLAILPIQLAARAAAIAKGLDPDRPAGLSKVTLIDYAAR
ncbi:MAG: hypothetical protein QOE60_1085 [Thermoleophilaceae bacterium]|nr:hypothetical protein [Thermoleophilaceae bacterium]